MPAYYALSPQAKQQLAQLMWLRQSEVLVLEALVRLAALPAAVTAAERQGCAGAGQVGCNDTT